MAWASIHSRHPGDPLWLSGGPRPSHQYQGMLSCFYIDLSTSATKGARSCRVRLTFSFNGQENGMFVVGKRSSMRWRGRPIRTARFYWPVAVSGSKPLTKREKHKWKFLGPGVICTNAEKNQGVGFRQCYFPHVAASYLVLAYGSSQLSLCCRFDARDKLLAIRSNPWQHFQKCLSS